MGPNPLPFTRLLAAVRSAESAVDAAHDKEPVDEQEADQAVKTERIAREELIDWLVSTFGTAPVAIVLADGSIVTYCDNADGLSVVASANVHQIR